jgi:polyphosphate kinase
MADINKVFNVLKKPKDDYLPILKTCKNLGLSAVYA